MADQEVMTNKPPIIAIDAASYHLGYAIMRSTREVTDCGLISHSDRVADKTPFDRIDRICRDLVEIVKPAMFECLDTAVLEISSGKQAGRMKGRMSGLCTLGYAIASVRSALLALPGMKVVLIKENEWTRRQRKETRASIVHSQFPKIDWSKDPGMDVADAVGLGLYYLTCQEMMNGTR